MRVERLELTNFRGIRHLELEFPTQTTVLVGINGVGKSAILDAVRYLLLRGVRKLYPRVELQARFLEIRSEDVLNGEKEAHIAIAVRGLQQRYSWGISAASGGMMGWLSRTPDDLRELDVYLATLKKQLEDGTQASIPVLAQYSTDRGMWSSAVDNEGNEGRGFSPADHPLAAYEGALPAGIGDFSAFIQWFRRREDFENERRARGQPGFEDPQLKAVRDAVETLMEGFSKLQIERQRERMTIQKGREVLDIYQLSAGEKALLSLVADLARRLSIANPEAAHPRVGEGVVLIDEVDLHLHPRWQRKLVGALERVFPNCQFIVTTHSPQVISEVKPECIYLLERKDGETIARRPEASFGLDSNRILEDLMGVDERPSRIKERLTQFFRLIDDGKLDEAKALRRELEAEIGSDEPNFAKGEVLIRRKEMLAGASHRPQR